MTRLTPTAIQLCVCLLFAAAMPLLTPALCSASPRPKKFDPEMGEFASWACAIAQNHVRNFRRHEATRLVLLSEEVAE